MPYVVLRMRAPPAGSPAERYTAAARDVSNGVRRAKKSTPKSLTLVFTRVIFRVIIGLGWEGSLSLEFALYLVLIPPGGPP